MNLPAYRKTITAVVTGLIGWAAVVISSEAVKISGPEWIMLATVLATALGVYSVKNESLE